MKAPDALIAAAPAQRFAVLNLTSVSLLVPLSEVYSLESVLDVDSHRTFGRSIGAVSSAGQWFPVFGLSDELDPLDKLPESFRVCAILAAGDSALALACRSVTTLESGTIHHHSLPECMRTARTPVQALAYDGERLFCRTSLTDLVPFIESAA